MPYCSRNGLNTSDGTSPRSSRSISASNASISSTIAGGIGIVVTGAGVIVSGLMARSSTERRLNVIHQRGLLLEPLIAFDDIVQRHGAQHAQLGLAHAF